MGYLFALSLDLAWRNFRRFGLTPPNPATNNFSVRLRREDTSAIWAPNTEAFICDEHAACGFNVDVQLSLRQDHQLETAVSAGGTVARRRTPITNMP